MRVLLIGANSYVASGVIDALRGAGHELAALARTPEIARSLRERAIEPVTCDIDYVADATGGLEGIDACIWLSFVSLRRERCLIAPLLEAMTGSGKTFIFTSGSAVVGVPCPDGEGHDASFAEDDPFTPPPGQALRAETERFVRDYAERSVRAMVVRPPMVWGRGGSRQIPWIIETVGKTGSACYVGAGRNRYSHVHVDDLGALYRLALEKGRAGALYHAVAGDIEFRSLADAVAEAAGTKAKSVSLDRMGDLIGDAPARIGFGLNSVTRCPSTCSELGWTPRQRDIVADILHGSYRDAIAKASPEPENRTMNLVGGLYG